VVHRAHYGVDEARFIRDGTLNSSQKQRFMPIGNAVPAQPIGVASCIG